MRRIILCCLLAVAAWGAAQADIIPGPKPGKGIVPGDSTRVRMAAERVTIQLYRDHSEVECLFEMVNTGDKEEMEVGFPLMDFELLNADPWSKNFKGDLQAWVNGEKVDTVEMYMPEDLKRILAKRDSRGFWENVRQRENADKPWYVWKCVFPAGDTVRIKVTYTLPNSNNKRYYYTSYYLHTGAGWHGTIGKAVVNMINHDIPEEEIHSVRPEGFRKEGNTYTWTFEELEPTWSDDIGITFGRVPTWGEVMETRLKTRPFIIDGKKSTYEESKRIPQEDIAQYITRNDNEPHIVIYTKAFVLNRLLPEIKKYLPNVYKRMSKASPGEWEKAYDFTLNEGKASLWLFPMELKVTNITLTDAKTKEEKPVIAITCE